MSITQSVANVGDKVTETVNSVGDKISAGVEKAADWMTEKAYAVEHRIEEAMGVPGHASQIQDHMDVIASCGTLIGSVDRVEGDSIKLTRSGGQHHFIPLSWVDHVDQHVHLNKNSMETFDQWRTV